MNVDGAEFDVGFWIRGSGVEGAQGDDLRFVATVRHWDPEGLAECSFAIDATRNGESVQICDGPVGRVDVTVEPQCTPDPCPRRAGVPSRQRQRAAAEPER